MRWLLLLALAGCGRFGFDLFGDDAPSDAAIDAPAPFTMVAPITELNTADEEDDPSLTADMLELYFDSDRPGSLGYGDIWVSKRATTSEPWGTPTLVAELASASDDTGPEVSLDGLTIYFASERATGTGNRDLFVATRADRMSAWSTPTRIVELSSSVDESSAMATADGLHLYFQSLRSGSEDVFVAHRSATNQPWTQVATVTNVADPTLGEGQHWINDDATQLYFTAGAPITEAGSKIWMTSRASPAEDFAPPTLVDMVVVPEDEADPWLSPDRRTMFFTRTIGGKFDLYMATR